LGLHAPPDDVLVDTRRGSVFFANSGFCQLGLHPPPVDVEADFVRLVDTRRSAFLSTLAKS
jgi:hypothetical protein